MYESLSDDLYTLIPVVAERAGWRAAAILLFAVLAVLVAIAVMFVRARGNREEMLELLADTLRSPIAWVVGALLVLAFAFLALTFRPYDYRNLMAVRCADGSLLVTGEVVNELGDAVEEGTITMAISEMDSAGEVVVAFEGGGLAASLPDREDDSSAGPSVSLVATYEWFPRTIEDQVEIGDFIEFEFTKPNVSDTCAEGTQLCAEGTFLGDQATCARWSLWVFAADEYDNYYLQSPAVGLGMDGTWSTDNVRPGEGVSRLELVWVREGAVELVEQAVEDAEWRFVSLPDDSLVLASQPVVVEPPAEVSDQDVIWELARETGYANEGGEYAPVFGNDDAGYWAQQLLMEAELRQAFEARAAIVSLAEVEQLRIESTGDLSYWAEQYEAGMSLGEIEAMLREAATAGQQEPTTQSGAGGEAGLVWKPWPDVVQSGAPVSSRDRIWELAREHGYDNTGGSYAPVLDEGDVSYWVTAALTEPELSREFQTRGMIIDLAEEKHIHVSSVGVLGHWAQMLEAGMPLDEIESKLRE